MASLTITIPDDKVDRVRDAFASEFGWTPELGVTKTQFLKQQIITYVKQVTRNFEGNIAAGLARNTVESDVEGINIT